MTVKEVREAAKNSKYLLLRFASGHKMGVNSKSVFLGNNKNKRDGLKTDFVSFKPIDINEYISVKHPFMLKK